MTSDSFFGRDDGDPDDHDTDDWSPDGDERRGPRGRWFIVASGMVVVGLLLSLLLGQAGVGRLSEPPQLEADGSFEIDGGQVSVYLQDRAYDTGGRCSVSGPDGTRSDLDYQVDNTTREVDGVAYVRVGLTPADLDPGTYVLDCPDVQPSDVVLRQGSGLGGAAWLIVAAVVVGVGLVVVGLMSLVVMGVLRLRGRRRSA